MLPQIIGRSVLACSMWLLSTFNASAAQEVGFKFRGQLIEASPVATYSQEQAAAIFKETGLTAQNGFTVYKIIFSTVTPTSMAWPIKASGLVIVPSLASAEFPWISLQHGTAISKGDAPTRRPSEGFYEASQGFVVVIPDYIGYGASDQVLHPYLIKDGYTESGVDMLRAARSLARQKSFKLSSLFIQGYSEGGYATLALQRALETKYAKEFQLKGSAPNAGPHDVEVIAEAGLAAPQNNPLYTAIILLALERWRGWGLDMDYIFNYDVATLRKLLASEALDPEVVKSLPTETRVLLNPEFIDDFLAAEPQGFQARLLHRLFAEQSLNRDNWVPKVPTRFHHCVDDEVVPVSFSQNIYEHFQKLDPSAPVSAKLLPSADANKPYRHTSCPLYYAPAAFFKEILANAP